MLIGNRVRGPSNSIASPGVSALFGGVTTSVGKPAELQSRGTGAGVQPAPFRPHTAQATMSRYTPTYASNAFGHAEYKAPLNTTESAADRILKTTGTSVEDYGRRNVKWDKDVFLQAHVAAGRTPASQSYKREIVTGDCADCANCTNHNIASQKKSESEHEKQTILKTEQQRFSAIRQQEEQEILNTRSERLANQSEMNSTLQQISDQKRAEWEAKKNDTTNLEQTKKLKNQIQELTWKNINDRVKTQHQYKDELNRKKEEAINSNINGKITDRELERRLNGLQFECYERDPKMKAETQKTGGYIKHQIDDSHSRKQQEKDDMVRPPEVFYTDKELGELRTEAVTRDREVREHNLKNAQVQLGQHYNKVDSAHVERQRVISEENEHLNRLQQLQEEDNMNKRRNRDERKNEWATTLSKINNKKSADWEAKKTDQTNKLQSQNLQNEIKNLTQNNLLEQWRQKVEYNKDLSNLTAAQEHKHEQDGQHARDEESKANGLTFECYTRDPKMRAATKETGHYQKIQKKDETAKRQHERQEIIQPPSSLVTTKDLNKMHHEALELENDRRSDLKSVMQSQYNETKAQKDAHVAYEKARDTQEVAQTAARNTEITLAEKHLANVVKQDYDGYLRYQVGDAEQKRLQEIADRRYDPNTERMVQENSRIGEKIVKCGACTSTLAHERTIFEGDSNGHAQ
jgi:hypothetical protein